MRRKWRKWVRDQERKKEEREKGQARLLSYRNTFSRVNILHTHRGKIFISLSSLSLFVSLSLSLSLSCLSLSDTFIYSFSIIWHPTEHLLSLLFPTEIIPLQKRGKRMKEETKGSESLFLFIIPLSLSRLFLWRNSYEERERKRKKYTKRFIYLVNEWRM